MVSGVPAASGLTTAGPEQPGSLQNAPLYFIGPGLEQLSGASRKRVKKISSQGAALSVQRVACVVTGEDNSIPTTNIASILFLA